MLKKETSRQLKGKATKKKIFAVAKELILSKGYNNVTVDEICEKCEISKGTFYIYYKSKEDIVKKLYRDDMSEYMEENFGTYIRENKEASPADKLKTFIMVALEFPVIVGEELTKLTYIVYLSLKSSEGSFFSDCIKQELLFDTIDEGRSQSVFRKDLSTEEIVNYVYSFLTGACITWCLSEADYDIGKESEKYVDALIKGLRD
ncbi:TetR/AcrR family transcriptional regulator [Paenibacillus glycinis]|uniref:TetR family transcriptional regulator n=1 Tax=Paenibacillus glycinis TaxID=2697035 RepID=A0ABW9XQP2_9BACL|nr:TetR/AcrR family transcriptional regulator [Paenibacillus glycinis]NBD24961.1 TetR family transcriptional regulator [Paenibacillus glycinis]